VPVNYQELATGKYYEELEPGQIYKHAITRTVTETDNLLFTALTHNMAWLHLDEEYSKTQMFGKRLVNSNFTLSLVAGVGVSDITLGTTIANLGYDNVKFSNPVFFGDTIYTETEVISKRESKSRPEAGIVEFEIRGRNQHGEVVVSLRRSGLMIKKSSLANQSSTAIE
jgi:acyl dehydratase